MLWRDAWSLCFAFKHRDYHRDSLVLHICRLAVLVHSRFTTFTFICYLGRLLLAGLQMLMKFDEQ